MSDQHLKTSDDLLGLLQIFEKLIGEAVKKEVSSQQDRWPAVMDVPMTAKYLCRSQSAVREMERSGKIKRVKIDGCVNFRKRDIDELIEGREPWF